MIDPRTRERYDALRLYAIGAIRGFRTASSAASIARRASSGSRGAGPSEALTTED